MRFILLGPPGCGKGTQAKRLCTRLGLEHIGTGAILRDAIARNTPAGELARPHIEAGHLVPDEVVNALVAERFAEPDRPSRFILDGYPRTLHQGKALAEVLQRYDLGITQVLLFQVDEEELVRRVAGRWSCPLPVCKAVYHEVSHPPEHAGVCDFDGTRLVQRADDKEETVRERLAVYHEQTEELISFYEKQGLLVRVSGEGAIEDVYARILAVLQP